MTKENSPAEATKYIITPTGYASSRRSVNDSIVYFGTFSVNNNLIK